MDEDTKTSIREKIVELFSDNGDAFTRIMYFLDEEEKLYGVDGISPIWKTLKAAVKSNKLFKQYVNRLVEDTKTVEANQNYRILMTRIWSEMMEPSDKPENASLSQGFEIIRKGDMDMVGVNAGGGLAKSWSLIPTESQVKILDVIRKVVINKSAMSTVDDVFSAVTTVGGNAVMIGLAAIALTYDAWRNLKRWWNGEISGKRCAKNIVDSLASIGAGMGGGLAGASLGSLAGPVGTLMGGIAGSVIAGQAAMAFSDWLTQKIFQLPKSESLERAYKFFGVGMTASAEQINSKYRQLCLRHHPDKGGREQDFHEVQIQMGIIKLARGQVTN